MKTTNIFQLRLGSICVGCGLLLSILWFFMSSCEVETFEIAPDPTEYDSLMVSTSNGKLTQFKLDSVYVADIVIGLSDKNDTIRFVKGPDNLTYFFIVPVTWAKVSTRYGSMLCARCCV